MGKSRRDGAAPRRRSRKGDFDGRPIEETPSQARAARNIVPLRVKRGVPTTIKRWTIYGAFGLTILAVLSTFVNSGRARDYADEAENLYSSAYNPSFKVRYSELGRQVVANWYNQEEPVVDLASNVRWPGVTASASADLVESSQDEGAPRNSASAIIPDLRNVVFIEGKQSSATIDSDISEKYPDYQNPYEELLHYYVVMNNQALTVSVVLVIPDIENPSLTPILMAPPSIDAADMVGNSRSEVSSNPVGVPGIAQVQASPQVESTVRLWAQSWASNNSNALRITAQDNEQRSYFGLGGWTTDDQSVRINWSYSPTKDNVSTHKSQADEDKMLLEVEFLMYQTPTNRESGIDQINEKTQFSNVQVMNLLITKANTNSPAIVAWGPSGSWSELEPYMNGVNDSELNSVQKDGALGNTTGGSGQGSRNSNGGGSTSSSTSSSSSSTSSSTSSSSPTTTSSSDTDSDNSTEGSNSESDSSSFDSDISEVN